MSSRGFAFASLLLSVIAAQVGPLKSAQADQPVFTWQEGRQFDGRADHVVVPHGPAWLLDQGVVVLDFTADRRKGNQGLISKDAKGFLEGGHLAIWLDQGTVMVRLQDKQKDYVVQSSGTEVRKGVPTRLALAFGPGGIKLYLDGKMVGSNAYQGGLQGNQEPLVVGARDWSSSPQAADNLDAFFADTINALALYDRTLDGPAIAALGPAGTALAQAAGPGTASSSRHPRGSRRDADAAPTGHRHRRAGRAENAAGESRHRRATAAPGGGDGGNDDHHSSEELQRNLRSGDIRPERLLQQQQPLQVRSGVSLPLQPWRDEAPAVAMLWERAKKAAASNDMDEQRAALFVELVKAAFKPSKSDQELRALEWWARIMKLKRIQAAEGAQQAYADWQRGVTAPRASRVDVMLGNDKVNTPGYATLLASGFERVSGPGTAAANQSWPKVLTRLEATQVELQSNAGGDTDAQAIIDGVVMTLSLLKDGFTGWTTVAGTAYSIASNRWKQVQEAESLPGQLQGFLSFAKATTPSLTESLYTEEGAKQAYVALVETTL
jgi:hypothetical protein